MDGGLSMRRHGAVRGAFTVEYLATIAALAIGMIVVLAAVDGPRAFKNYRIAQRAAAAPMP